jgi:beta-lactamase regulating signal transducer with metallopeptidase domain
MNELAGLLLEAWWRIVPPAVVAALIAVALRRRSPRIAHAVWAVMLAGMLLLPLLVAAGRRWPVDVPALRSVGPTFAEVLPEVLQGAPPSEAAPVRESPPPAAETGRSRPILRWGAVYGLGVTILLCRFLVGLWLARRVRRRCREIVHPRLEALARELLPGRGVSFCSSSAVRVPFTTGWLRARVFLPLDWEAWNDETLRGAVGHELCHVRRRDYAWAVLAELNRCLYWFHPIAWVLPGRLSRLADRISDEFAASAARSVTSYARLLVEMAERVSTGPGRLAPAARRRFPWSARAVSRDGWRPSSPGPPADSVCRGDGPAPRPVWP